MKTTYLPIIYFILLAFLCMNAAADEIQIPNNLWEKHMKGELSIALALVEKKANGFTSNHITVYIKNTSGKKKYLPNNANESSIQIFYINEKGDSIPLRDYSSQPPPIITMPPLPPLKIYQSGEMQSKHIQLNSSELIILKKYPAFCRFYISNQEFGEYKVIESTPQLLTQISENLSIKR